MSLVPASLGTQFNRLWAACASASVADGLRWAALPLAAAAVTRDPRMIALVSAAGFAPSVLSMPLGVAVDRVGPRRIFQSASALQAVAFMGFAVAITTGTLSVAVLCLASFLFGTGEVATDIAVESLPARLVGDGSVAAAYGRISATELTLEDLAGPALAGFLFVLAPAAPFVVAGVSVAVAVVVAARIRPVVAETGDAESVSNAWHDMQDGFRWLRGKPAVMTMFAAMALAATAGTAGEVVLVLFMLDVVGIPQVAFGAVLAVAAGGAVAGAAVSPTVVRRLGPARTVAAGLSTTAVMWFLLGLSSTVPAAVALLTAGTGALAMGRVAATSFRQAESSEAMRGRVASLYRTVMLAAQLAGSIIGGLVAGALGVRGPFLVGAPVVLVAALCLLGAHRMTPGQPLAGQASQAASKPP